MKSVKYTLKQIREWFKQLEENKYRKRYMIDAKRVHHYVNLGEDTDLPNNLQRKVGSYSREKVLAKQFKKFVREQARIAKKEQTKKVRNEGIITSIRKIVKESIIQSNRVSVLTEGKELDQKVIDKIAKLTDKNYHTEARIELAKELKLKDLVNAYKAVDTIHMYLRRANETNISRDALDKKLFAYAEQKFSNFKDIEGSY
jgi:hypothetical protein